MHKCYHPLACDERCQIRVLRSRGFSMRSIARDLGRDPATINREMARNRGGRGYRHRQAQEKAVAGRSALAGTRALTARPKAPPDSWPCSSGRPQFGKGTVPCVRFGGRVIPGSHPSNHMTDGQQPEGSPGQ